MNTTDTQKLFIVVGVLCSGCATSPTDIEFVSTNDQALVIVENAYELPGSVHFIPLDVSNKKVLSPQFDVSTFGDNRLRSSEPGLALPVDGLEGIFAIKDATRFSVATTKPGKYVLRGYGAYAGGTTDLEVYARACAGSAAPVFEFKAGVANIVLATDQPMHKSGAKPVYKMSATPQAAESDLKRVLSKYPKIQASPEAVRVIGRIDLGNGCNVRDGFEISGR